MSKRSRIVPPEDWKPIPGFEGIYEVSKCGLIRALTVTRQHGGYRPREIPGRLLHGKKHYGAVTLWSLDGKPTFMGRHVAVARAWIPNPKNYPVVRHLDDDKENHHVSNLAWGTHQDNANDALRNGIFKHHKLTVEQVKRIKRALTCGLTVKQLAHSRGVSKDTIWRISTGRGWTHVTCN